MVPVVLPGAYPRSNVSHVYRAGIPVANTSTTQSCSVYVPASTTVNGMCWKLVLVLGNWICMSRMLPAPKHTCIRHAKTSSAAGM